jgi:hypothetical protein
MMKRTMRWPLRAGALVLCATPSALGAPQLDYDAPPSCPSHGDFVASVARRGVDLATHAPNGVAGVAVRIVQSGNAFTGELRVAGDASNSAPRQVTDTDCARVADGLAAVTAIVLGAEPPPEESEPTPAPAPVAETAPPAKPAPSSSIAPVPAKEESPEPTPPLRGSTFSTPQAIDVPAGKVEFVPSRAWALTAGADFGSIPSLVMPRYDLSASIVPFLVTPDKDTHMLGPILQVRWALIGPGTWEQAGRERTDIWGFQVGLASCSAFAYDTKGFSLMGCAEFLAELWAMQTHGPGAPRESSPGSGSAGLVLDARYDLGAGFFLAGRGGGRFRISKLRAEDSQGEQLFESGYLGAYVSAGLGFTF